MAKNFSELVTDATVVISYYGVKKQNTFGSSYAGGMDQNIHQIVAENLRRLMDDRGWVQKEVAKRAGVSQKTVSDLLNVGSRKGGPNVASVDAVARAFGLEAWHLLIPGQPIALLKSKSVEKLVECYRDVDDDGRRHIEHVVEREATFAAQKAASVGGSKKKGSGGQ